MDVLPQSSIFRSVARRAESVTGVPAEAEREFGQFCGAALELLAAGASGGVVLFSVLPSLATMLGRVDAAAVDRLQSELDHGRKVSEQLRQLALIHGGPESGSLAEKLDRGLSEAAHVIESLQGLSNSAGNSQSPETETHFRNFCRGVLDLLNGGTNQTSILSRVLPSLAGIFRDLTRDTVNELKAEKQAWEERSAQLIELAFSYSRDEADALCQRLERTQSQAQQVIDALEQLHGRGATATANSATASDTLQPAEPSGTGLSVSALLKPEAPAVDAKRAEAFCTMAVRCQRNRDLGTAEILYGEALKADPHNRFALVNRGRIRLLRGAAARALDDLDAAVRLGQDDAGTYALRGDAHLLSGHLDPSLQDYERSLDLAPDEFLVRYNRAVALRQKGLLDSALAELDQLVLVNAAHGPLYLNRGLIWQLKGDLARAAVEFRTALEHLPNSREALERLREVEQHLPANETVPPALETVPPETALVQTAPRPSSSEVVARGKPLKVGKGSRPPGEVSAPSAMAAAAVEDDLAIQMLEAPPAPPGDDTPLPIIEEDLTETPDISSSEVTVADDSATTTDKPKLSGVTTDVLDRYSLEFVCPECGAVSKVRWNRLQQGRVLSCPHCRRSFTSQGDGTLIEVVKTKKGQWRTVRQDVSHFTLRNRLIGGAAIAVFLVGVIFGRGMFSGARDDVGYPPELEPRAKVFALAWLKGDLRTMRQLTDPVHSERLFDWCMNNPVPMNNVPVQDLERRVRFKVVMLPGDNESEARMQVYIEGLDSANGREFSGLPLAWKQDGVGWLFQPGNKS